MSGKKRQYILKHVNKFYKEQLAFFFLFISCNGWIVHNGKEKKVLSIPLLCVKVLLIVFIYLNEHDKGMYM